MGPDLMEAMRAQAERFGAQLVRDDVTAVSLTGPVKTVTDGEGTTWSARTVILAMGSAYRQMGLPDEKRLSGHGVSWCATCDGFFFRGQDIVVVGGGDSAVEEATFLTKFAQSVTIVHRRDELRASKIMADRAMANPKIRFAWNSAVEAIHGQDKVTGVTLRDTLTGATRLLPATGVFVAIGHDPRNELIKGVVDLDEHGYVKVQGRSTATNIAGVFAAGDLVDHTYRQAITAAGSGCAAALDAEHHLRDLEPTPNRPTQTSSATTNAGLTDSSSRPDAAIPERTRHWLRRRSSRASPSSPPTTEGTPRGQHRQDVMGPALCGQRPGLVGRTEHLGRAAHPRSATRHGLGYCSRRGPQCPVACGSRMACNRGGLLRGGTATGRIARQGTARPRCRSAGDPGGRRRGVGSAGAFLRFGSGELYLHLPKQQRSAIMGAAAEAVRPRRNMVVGHDAEPTSGHGGPQGPSCCTAPVTRGGLSRRLMWSAARRSCDHSPTKASRRGLDALVARPPRRGLTPQNCSSAPTRLGPQLARALDRNRSAHRHG